MEEQMKRILHIIAQTPGRTGSGIFLQAILKQADEKGYKQSVIAGIPKNQIEFGLENNKSVKLYPVIFETDNLPFPVVGMSDVMPYRSTRYSDLNEDMFIKWKKSFSDAILEAVDDFKPDYIISHHLWILTALVKQLLPNTPVISICHGTDIRQLSLSSKYADYVIDGCRNIEMALALNEYQKKVIIEKYGISEKKIMVIGGGYNSDIFYPPQRKNTNNVIKLIYAGKLSFSKGVPSLIKAYNRMESHSGRVELFIAGSGSGKEEEIIKKMAKDSKMKITFLGALAQSDLADAFRNSDIFILPSFYEGLSLVLIEALACGLLTVSTDLPGLKSWLGHEINNSGVVKFVKLPSLVDVDVPCERELPEFELRLKEAIESQVVRVGNPITKYEDVHRIIEKMSWKGIFESIESSLLRI
jgi:glycosyltransferase involved in cell wall biosynthesis